MNNKNLILAIVLSLAVLIGSNIYFAKQTPKKPVVQPQAEQTAVVEQQVKKEMPLNTSNATPVVKKENKFQEKDIEVETDLLKVVLTTNGAKIKKYLLKDFKDEKGEQINLAGGLNAGLDGFANVEFKSGRINTQENAQKIYFTYNSKDIKITKEFEFVNGKYNVNCLIKIENIGKNSFPVDNFIISIGPGLGTPDKLEEFEELTATTFINDNVKKDKIKKIKTEITNKGEITALVLSKKFFVSSVILQDVKADSSIIKKEFLKDNAKDITSGLANLKLQQFNIQPNSSNEVKFTYYSGPSTLENLRALKIHKVLDFGWFSGLGVLLLVVLKFFYKLVNNYGLAIILLTVFIKVILWWPTDKSMKSMKKMQKLQPQMTALREQYKNNPQQMNVEVMKLYKTHKVNPLGGCLPMLLQIPIFYALYMVLVNSVELRNAPFYFWIIDLSVKDHYYVIPILMGVTMFIQQKMTPSPDPSQAKIMLILPVVFTFMFINLPSGVVLYWTAQNILSIVQQFYINKHA